MTNQELQQRFDYCKWLGNPEEWQLLAMAYYQRGYFLNALHCFKQAEDCVVSVQS
jgi:hypothetical protein